MIRFISSMVVVLLISGCGMDDRETTVGKHLASLDQNGDDPSGSPTDGGGDVPVCQDAFCALWCPNGYKKDAAGCDTCECEEPAENPCEGVLCEEGSSCVVLETFPPQARCVKDPAPEPVKCGENTCGDGLVCCNESCGICAAPDEACIQIFCG